MASGIQRLPSSKLKIDLIWTNPNAAGPDPGGTYEVEGLSSYKILYIHWHPLGGTWRSRTARIIFPQPNYEVVTQMIRHIDTDASFGYRLVKILNNTVTIGEGVYAPNTSQASNTCLLEFIRGIK